MMVNVPVMLVNERCVDCPELDIETNTLEMGDMVERFYSNSCACKHLYRCNKVLLNQSSRNEHASK